jgi:hypothetical protein
VESIEWAVERTKIQQMTLSALSGNKFIGFYLNPEDILGVCNACDAKPPTHILHLSGGDTAGVFGKLNHPRRCKHYQVYLQVKSANDWEVVCCLESSIKPNKHTRMKYLRKLPTCFIKESLIIGDKCYNLSLTEYISGLIVGYPYPWEQKIKDA